MDELTDEDRAEVDQRRRADRALDEEIRALQQASSWVRECDPAELRAPGEVVTEDLLEAALLVSDLREVRLHDGAVAADPDQAVGPGSPGILASRLLMELARSGWVLDLVDEDLRSLRRPGTGEEVLFPFADDAWIGPNVQARFRRLIRRGGAR